MGWFEDLSGSSQSQTSGIRVAPETALEQYANPMLQRGLQGFEGLVGAGPGEAQMRAGTGATEDYAKMLQGFMTPEGMFAAQNKGVEQYSRLGEQIFGGQMRQQQAESARMAARMGRPVTDPVLQAKLAQQRADTVGSFAAQQAVNMPQQLAQYGGARAEALQGLASQAMANRQALLGMGSNLREQDRAYRINTGERYSNQKQEGSFMSSLGGIAGIAGSALQAYGSFGNSQAYQKSLEGKGGVNPTAGPKDTTGGMSQAQLSRQINADDPVLQRMFAQNRGGGQQAAPSPIQQFTGGGGLGFGGGMPYLSSNPAMQQLASGGGFTPDFNYNYGAPVPTGAGPGGQDMWAALERRQTVQPNIFNTGPGRSSLPGRPSFVNPGSVLGRVWGN